jgi:cytoskeletal protein CcmA (bactofilin family)
MWKTRKEDEKPLGSQSPSQAGAASAWEPKAAEAPKLEEPRADLARTIRAEMARIGKLVSVKGELSGREDLFVDGEVEGSVELSGHGLTVGPNGRIRANIQAQTIVVFGRVEGNVKGSERVELRKSAVVTGDILTQRIVIEDGAFLKGGIDIQKPEPKAEIRREFVAAAPTSATVGAAVATPAAFPEQK